MILETLFSGLGTSAVEKLLNLARQRNDARLRAMIQEELEKVAPAFRSNSVIVVNIHIGDLIQQVHILAESGLSPSSIIEAAHSHTLPALLSTGSTPMSSQQQHGPNPPAAPAAEPKAFNPIGKYTRQDRGRNLTLELLRNGTGTESDGTYTWPVSWVLKGSLLTIGYPEAVADWALVVNVSEETSKGYPAGDNQGSNFVWYVVKTA